MDFGHLLSVYGLVVVFFITVLNLSVVLVLAGFAAHQGFLNLYWAIAVSTAGSFVFSQIYFILGRYGMHKWLLKHPHWQEKMDRFNSKISKLHAVFATIFLYRFIPGFRVVSPFLMGPLRVSWWLFAIANFLGALVWSIIFVVVGYYFGALAERFFKDASGYEWYVVGAVVVITVIWWCIHHYRKTHLCSKK